MNATTKSLGLDPRWARSPWTTNCSTPRSPPWRANALWPAGGRDDEPDALALFCLLLWLGASCARVGRLARRRLPLFQRDRVEHDLASSRSDRRMFGRGTGGPYPSTDHRLRLSRRGLPQDMGAAARRRRSR